MHVDQLHPRIQWVDENGYLTPFAFRWLNQAWERTGGPDDSIEELQNGELYEVGIIDTKLIDVMNQLNELELIVELQNKTTRIQELETRIEELELRLDMLSNPPNFEQRISDLEIDMEMNYGT